MKCPNCGLHNPPSAMRCDCGHDFETGLTPQETLVYTWKGVLKDLIEVFYLWIGFPLKCPKCSKRHSSKTTHCRCGFVYTEAKLANLISLSTETATRDTKIDLNDPMDIVLKCVEATGAAHAYCACQIYRDPTSERDYEIKWRLDLVKPDRFHVSQEVWDSDFDEWVIEGDQHYRFGGLWTQVTDTGWTKADVRISRSLLVDDFVTTLRTQQFVSAQIYHYQDNRYLLLTYEDIDSGDLTVEKQGLEWRIWVDLDTHLLAKAETSLKGQTPEGDEIQVEIQHAFAAYNDKIEVRPPTRFEKLDAKGRGVIPDEVEIIPHHP